MGNAGSGVDPPSRDDTHPGYRRVSDYDVAVG